MTQWYYVHDAGTHGPVADDELRRLAATGRLGPDSLVTPAGATRWFRATDYGASLGLRFDGPGAAAAATGSSGGGGDGDGGGGGGSGGDRAAIVEAAFGPALTDQADREGDAPAAVGPGANRPAGLGRRAMALLVDLAVFAVAAAVVCLAIGGVTISRGGSRTDYRVEGHGIAVVAGLALCYFGVLSGRGGRTVGKALTGLRVVDAEDGGPIGVVRGMGRFIAAVGLLICCLVPALVDAAWAVADPERRTLHDKLVDSMVVRAPGSARSGQSGRGRRATRPNSDSPSPSS